MSAHTPGAVLFQGWTWLCSFGNAGRTRATRHDPWLGSFPHFVPNRSKIPASGACLFVEVKSGSLVFNGREWVCEVRGETRFLNRELAPVRLCSEATQCTHAIVDLGPRPVPSALPVELMRRSCTSASGRR